ncbi:hypothetical protein [Oceanobacillus caeni]|uniref:DUF3168 domain-containing protein n=1 Tax=Oceanobacillus caeni TaxID=405946 RepID=A0ABR5MK19_9BACI|nr:hypothetical protein [Oceanobacillus caeni]KPH76072.1 hypothetical protein AFL42_07150 [Oceanobacillus caeni]
MDILSIIYNHLIADEYIKEQAFGRIKYYEYPETGDVINPHIVLDPLDDGSPINFADNTWTKLDFLIQIDVWTKNRTITLNLANTIRDTMWNELGFKQIKGPNEYDEGVFRKADRYRGTLYREDFDSL